MTDKQVKRQLLQTALDKLTDEAGENNLSITYYRADDEFVCDLGGFVTEGNTKTTVHERFQSDNIGYLLTEVSTYIKNKGWSTK